MRNRFDVIAKCYEKAISLYPEARNDHYRVLDLLDLKGSETVFETTAGTGFLTVKLAGLLPGGKLIVHDISKQMIKFSKEKIKKLGLQEKVDYCITDNLDLSISDESLDKAVCFGGFHHIEYPVNLFRTISRKLKPGGIFVVGDFADNSGVQRYFDERINFITSTGHQALFLSESQMVNFARFSNLKAIIVERRIAPFVFPGEEDVGIFYQLVHGLDQTPAECLSDIKSYLGVLPASGQVAVPMDYVYALYQKEA